MPEPRGHVQLAELLDTGPWEMREVKPDTHVPESCIAVE